MNRTFEVICESQIWTIKLDNIIYGEYEHKELAIHEARKLAIQHETSFVVHDPPPK